MHWRTDRVQQGKGWRRPLSKSRAVDNMEKTVSQLVRFTKQWPEFPKSLNSFTSSSLFDRSPYWAILLFKPLGFVVCSFFRLLYIYEQVQFFARLKPNYSHTILSMHKSVCAHCIWKHHSICLIKTHKT